MITNYKEMPLGMFNQYYEILKKYKPENDEQIKDLDAMEMQVETISLLSGMTKDEVYSLPLEKYKSMANSMSFLQHKCEPGVMQSKYKVGKYVLVPMGDIEKWSADQYISYQTFIKAGDVAGILSCAMVPKKMKFSDGYDLAELRDLLDKNLSFYDAMTISAFFLHKFSNSIGNMITCSMREVIMKIPRKERMPLIRRYHKVMRSLKNGDGLGM